MAKPLYEFTINIADICLKVHSETDLNRFADIPFYKNFRTSLQKNADCLLELRTKVPKFSYSSAKIFNPQKNWCLFELKKKHLLWDGRPLRRDYPDSVIVLNKNYSQGIIYKRNALELFRRFLDQFIIINLLSRHQGFLLHASGVAWKKRGLAFIGESRAGKSSLIKIFAKKTNKKNLLCDDRLAVRKYQGRWFIYGTPWHGEVSLTSVKKAKLKALFFIKHAPDNFLCRLSQGEAYQRLLKNSILPFWDKSAMLKVLRDFANLVAEVPVYEMGFLPDHRIIYFIEKETHL